MSKSDKYVPKHRAPGKHKAVHAPRRALRTGVALTGLAAVATGVSVTGGIASNDPDVLAPAAADVATTAPSAAVTPSPEVTADAPDASALERRSSRQVASRSGRRTDKAKATALAMSGGSAVTRSEKLSEGDPRDIARVLLPAYGFSSDQFSCLDSLYVSESDWRVDADNPTSSAYGIPQALPGSKMASAGADWETNPVTQIRWGLGYIQDRYGSPCGAWAHSESHGWY